MELRVFVEPHVGVTYDEVLATARVAEDAGFGAVFTSDHYLSIHSGVAKDQMPGSLDAWITLAGLARETRTIRLGTLMSSATFRLPGPLAISVAQVDQMSGGRVELGLGAGWFEAEHAAYGIPFPEPAGLRFDRLEEQFEVLTGLWAAAPGATFDHDGPHYRLAGSPGLPKPLQHPGPPLLVGGKGTRRTPALAARFADEINVAFASIEKVAEVFAAADRACEAIGRDPTTLVRSAALKTCVGTGRELARRREWLGRHLLSGDHGPDAAVGAPDEVAECLARWSAIGVTRAYLQFMDLTDLDHVRLAGEAVGALVAGLPGPALR